MTTPTFALRITQHRQRIADILARTYKRDQQGRFGSGSGGVRQSLQDAQTTEAVAGVLKSEVSSILGHDVRVGLAGLDVDVARQHAEGILRGAEAYPEARLRAVGTYGPDSPFGHHAGMREDAYAVTARGEDIWFNTDHGQMHDSASGMGLHESMASSDAVGHLAGTHGDLTRIAVHEFGHVVDATTDSRMGKAALRIAKELAGPTDRKAFTRTSVSRYAATNGSELAAEAFMDVVSQGSGASLLSQRIVAEGRGLAGDLYDLTTPTFLLRLSHARERAEIAARTYERDQDGKFASAGGGVRDALSGAGSAEAVGAAATAEAKRITGRDISFDFGDADPKLAGEYAEGILRGLERFPDAKLTRVETAGNWGARNYAGTTPDGDGYKIMFNRELSAGDGSRMREALAKEGPPIHVSADPMGVALHEFGHVVANGSDANHPAHVAAGMYVLDHAPAGTLSRKYIGSHLSQYAASDYNELAAEAFSDVMMRGGSAPGLAHAVFSALEDPAATLQTASEHWSGVFG